MGRGQGQLTSRVSRARREETTSFAATIDFIMFPRGPKISEDGYTIARARHEITGEIITLKGKFGPVVEGELIQVTRGVWRDDRYGEYFIVWARTHEDPVTSKALLHYLEGLPGVGPALAQAIVDTLGENCLEKIDRDPELLLTVKSRTGHHLKKEDMQNIAQRWNELRAERRNMLFLSSLGYGDAAAKNISQHFGADCQARLKANPYAACEVEGIGFRTADAAARKMGIGPNDLRRLAAGVEYVIASSEADGHVCLERTKIIERAPRYLGGGITNKQLEKALDRMIAAGHLWSETYEGLERIYTTEFYIIETRLYKHLEKILSQIPDPDAIPSYIKADEDSPLTDEQYRAIWRAREYPFSLLTGSPGTGKTTALKGLLDDLDSRGETYVCLAPTGKAAKRMAESTGRKAMTIHRRLGWEGREKPQMITGSGLAPGANPFTEDVVVVDEASMLDMRLAERLFSHLKPTTRVVFVGDPDQLPAVGAGSVLLDLIESGRVPRTHLTQVFRQEVQGKNAASLLLVNAARIRDGQEPYWSKEELQNLIKKHAADPKNAVWHYVPEGTEVIKDDFRFIEATSDDVAVREVLRLAREAADELLVTDDKVLITAPMRRGGSGTHALNRILAEERNPHGFQFRKGADGLRVGDRVMNIQNHYGKYDPNTRETEPDIMNGDMGLITSYDEVTKTCVVRFDEGELRYARDELDCLIPAYACTTHKLQGSEAPAIVCPYASSSASRMLSRNLIYTAITRAKSLALVVGNKDIIRAAIKVDGSKRNTTLDLRVGAIPKLIKRRYDAVQTKGLKSAQQLLGNYALRSVGHHNLTKLGRQEAAAGLLKVDSP